MSFHARRLENCPEMRELLSALLLRGQMTSMEIKRLFGERIVDPTLLVREMRAGGVEVQCKFMFSSATGRKIYKYFIPREFIPQANKILARAENLNVS